MGSIDKRMKMLYNSLKLDNTKLFFASYQKQIFLILHWHSKEESANKKRKYDNCSILIWQGGRVYGRKHKRNRCIKIGK